MNNSMAQRELLLSPHSDDLVYSAFTLLIRRSTYPKQVVTIFNVSRHTKFVGPNVNMRLQSLITEIRKLEDAFVLKSLAVASTHLDLPDRTAAGPLNGAQVKEHSAFSYLHGLDFPLRARTIVCPMGLGGNPDHILTRSIAISLWKAKGGLDYLVFYEDLPYATIVSNLEEETRAQLAILSETVGSLAKRVVPLTTTQLLHKIMCACFYFSQTNRFAIKSIVKHAKRVGSDEGFGLAERFYVSGMEH